MTDKAKLEEITKLADAMYYAAQHLTTDASRLPNIHKHDSINTPISAVIEMIKYILFIFVYFSCLNNL